MASISRFAALFICAFFATSALAEDEKSNPRLIRIKRYLVLGGNGLLGSELVTLLRTRPEADVTIVNRGNWYWDSYHRIKPFVTWVKCDRFTIKECTELKNVGKQKFFFDAVYDFSAYFPNQVRDFLEIMHHRIGRYVFISTDSVYEVSELPPNYKGEPTREEEAVRPESKQKQEELAMIDGYGHRKLACEEMIQEEFSVTSIRYMIIRIPDVIGIRDNTDRMWFYFLWVKFHKALDMPVHFPPRLHNKKLSFVYSEDVAKLLTQVPYMPKSVFNQVYNLAFKELVTLEEFVKLMAEKMGVGEVKFDTTKENGITYYPSVRRGPVNITKAERMLSWQPQTLTSALEKSVQFYNYAMTASEFRVQRDGAIQGFLPVDLDQKFQQKFKEMYGQDLSMKKYSQEL